jgi:hypothetical protein
MSVGPLGGLAGSVAGTSLAQAKGADIERAQNEANSHERRVQTDRKADNAAGIGATDGEDHEAAERDADGRRIWEDTRRKQGDDSPEARAEPEPPRTQDATGQSGTLLDLSG